ncbi:MAG: DUF262 domain-containing protein [Nitrosomonadales bacterium]|nr:DUF262 domain-containing protein [Nitrosomonadales bacterium]
MQDDIEFENEIDERAEHEIKRDRLSQAVMYTADWTVETAISQLKQGNIFLQPTFQRRDAWRVDRKSRLIESILLGLPIPQIVLAERQDERGKFIVLDGKQRLLTLLQFVGQADASVNNDFTLRGLEILEELNGSRFNQLNDDIQRQFLNYAIRSSIIRNWPDPAFLEIVFVRLNEGSVKLSPQELRQGMFPGPFSTYLEEASASSLGLRRLLKLDEPDFRMRDTELLLRLVAFSLFSSEYRGNMKAFLDDNTGLLNREWGAWEGKVSQVVAKIESAINFGLEAFGEDKFGRKWVGGRFERPLNRAVLEVQVTSLMYEDVRNLLAGKQAELVTTFQRLSAEENQFNRSVEVTTKSLDATRKRFLLWSTYLADVTGIVRSLKIGE